MYQPHIETISILKTAFPLFLLFIQSDADVARKSLSHVQVQHSIDA
jgi:hypothetical protein